MKLYFIRHGETDWNAEGKLQGQTDIEINKRGVEQAQSLGKELRPLGVDFIVSSDLKRAKQTATIVASLLNAPVHTDTRLRECCFGSYEGMAWDEIEEKYRIKKSQYFSGENASYSFKHVGGEDRDDVVKRTSTLVQELARKYPDKSILLVGHGTSMNTLLSSFGLAIGLKRGEWRELDY